MDEAAGRQRLPPRGGGAGRERHGRTALVYYGPTQWAAEERYVAMRPDRDGDHPWLLRALGVMLVTRDDLSLPELVRRHRGMQD